MPNCSDNVPTIMNYFKVFFTKHCAMNHSYSSTYYRQCYSQNVPMKYYLLIVVLVIVVIVASII